MSEKLDRKTEELAVVEQRSTDLQTQYINELETNPKYSLKVNPEGKYEMTEMQVKFIERYVDVKSVATAAEYCGISMEEARDYYLTYSSQQEIKRINLALYKRQFATKLLSLDEIGGYLTSLLTDDNVASADRLKTPEKLRVAQMLIDLNKLKIDSLNDPSALMSTSIDVQIKNLSVETIRQLLTQEKKKKERIEVEKIVEDEVSIEELAYLNTLPTQDLLDFIEDTNKKRSDVNE